MAGCKGDPMRRQVLSPSPTQPRKQVTFEDPSPGRDTNVKQVIPSPSGDRQSLEATGSWPLSWAEEPQELGHLPELDPHVQVFLSGAGAPYTIDDDDCDWCSMPEPPYDNSNEWVKWHAHQVETLAWWPELQRIPNQTDTVQFARWVWASFQMPKVRCLTLKWLLCTTCAPLYIERCFSSP